MFENVDTQVSGRAAAGAVVGDGAQRTNRRHAIPRRLVAATASGAILVAVAGAACAAVPGDAGGSQAKLSVGVRNGLPVGAQPGQSSVSQPGLPIGGQPGQPSGGQPSLPVGGQPGFPIGGQPGAAATKYGAIAGVWKPTDGSGQELIVYPDGVVGMGAAGTWAFCAGNAQPAVGGSFPLVLANDDCVAYVDSGFSASSNADDSIVTVTTKSSSGSYAETYARAAASPAGPAAGGGRSRGDFTPLVGSWSNGTAGETFTVSASGAVTWTRLGQQGQTTSGTGSAQLLADGTFRITTTFGGPSVAGLWQVSVATGGKSITVIGSYGPDTFDRTAS